MLNWGFVFPLSFVLSKLFHILQCYHRNSKIRKTLLQCYDVKSKNTVHAFAMLRYKEQKIMYTLLHSEYL